MNLGNCPRCGKLFANNFRDVCPSCIKDIDKEYEKCAIYLRENRGSTIHELSEETGVSVRQITKFIREGRISIANAPNMSYPCEVCGIPIRDSNMCTECRAKLIREAVSSNEKPPKAPQPPKPGGAYQVGNRLRDES